MQPTSRMDLECKALSLAPPNGIALLSSSCIVWCGVICARLSCRALQAVIRCLSIILMVQQSSLLLFLPSPACSHPKKAEETGVGHAPAPAALHKLRPGVGRREAHLCMHGKMRAR